MTGYTKLFNSILGSSVWQEDPATKVVWITLLALSDRDGIVEASLPGLASFAHVTVDEVAAALNKFLAPDQWSRTPTDEGRRIEAVDGGWRLLNYEKYRAKMSPEDIRERNRIRQQRHRDRTIGARDRDGSVTECDILGAQRLSLHIEAESREQKAEGKKQRRRPSRLEERPESEECAKRLIDELALVADRALPAIVARSIDVLARVEGLQVRQAYETMVQRAKGAEMLNRFWFTDRKFLLGGTTPIQKQQQSVSERMKALAAECAQ